MSNIPAGTEKIQQEETEFRAAVSENVFKKMGAITNYALLNSQILPLGSIEMSMLNETEFQAQKGDGWVLCDGRDVSTSDFAALTGMGSAPDARGAFLRGKDNGRGLDPNGDPSLNSIQGPEVKPHLHTGVITNPDGLVTDGVTDANFGFAENALIPRNGNDILAWSLASTGIVESRPLNVTVNFYIRVN
jgi:hypothetical protein